MPETELEMSQPTVIARNTSGNCSEVIKNTQRCHSYTNVQWFPDVKARSQMYECDMTLYCIEMSI